MNFLNATLFGFPAWSIYAAIALVLGCVLLIVLLQMFRSKKAPAPKQQQKDQQKEADSTEGAVQDFMSTMRLSDTQRIDRLHRVVTLTVGQQADLKDLSFHRLSKFSITFGGVEQIRGHDFARIKLDLGGAVASCGASVEELGDNDFLVPRTRPDDPRCAIHYTVAKGDAVTFLQIKIQKVDPVGGSAEIDVLHLRGRQGGG